MMEWYLITYKRFEKRKLLDKQELIKTEDLDAGLKHIKTLNAQKRLTTTDYRSINLSELLSNNALQIVQKLTK